MKLPARLSENLSELFLLVPRVMPKTKAQQQETLDAILRLREWCPPGTTIYCILRHITKSKETKVIDFKVITNDEVMHIGYNVALALGWSYDRNHDGVRVYAVGMDAGEHAVHTLSYKLHGHENVNISESEKGIPIIPKFDKYKAGYSLICYWL